MRALISILTVVVLLCSPAAQAEDSAELEASGIAALKLSQTEPDAVVAAAIFFGKASASYELAKDDIKATEMNSFLYWCKKKMTSKQMDDFLSGKHADTAVVAKRFAEMEKTVVPVSAASKFLERAEAFAKSRPNDHLLIAIRYFEIADRFRGTDESLTAQDRSLNEMQLALKDTAANPVTSPKVVVPPSPATAAPADPGKRAAPSADELKAAEKLIKDLFKADYAKFDAPGRLALYAKLIQQADENKGDAASEYVLLHEARDLAVLANDAGLATQAQTRLRDGFKQDFAALLADLRKIEAAIKPAESGTAMAALYAQAADEAVAAEAYDQAVRFNSRAEDLIPMVKDPTLKARLKAEIPRVLAIKQQSAAALEAAKTLATKPNDVNANVIAGKFALLLGRFEKSFALLAKGNDSTLTYLAKTELAPPSEAAALMKFADDWFDRAEKEPSIYMKAKMQERAAWWYATALPGLTGLMKVKVEGRLKNLPLVLKTEIKEAALPENKVPKWISKDSSYIVSSTYLDFQPKPTLLNGETPAYSTDPGDGFSFATNNEKNAWVVIDLSEPYKIQKIEVVNRGLKSSQPNAKTLTVWISINDSGPWTEIWRAAETASQWEIPLVQPLLARYVKVGLREKAGLNLASIKIFGEKIKGGNASKSEPGNTSKTAPPAKTSTPPASNGSIPAGKLNADITYGPGELKMRGAVDFESLNNGSVTATFEPGTIVSSGEFNLWRCGRVRVLGTDEKPILFKNVKFTQDLSGSFLAKGAVFENCTFAKAGGWFAYLSTKWRFHGCAFYKCTFGNLTGVDCGFIFQGCTFVSMKLPEIKHKSDGDYLKYFRSDWNIIGGCCFVDCDVPPTVFWCSEQSSFVNCRFVPGLTMPMEKEWQVEAFVINCTGKISTETTGPPVKVVQAKTPYPGPFPPMCNHPELVPAYKILSDMHRGYKWISKNATYTVSSQENAEPSPTLLNGDRGCSPQGDYTFAFHSKKEDAPFIVIDLGTRQSVGALDIENRPIWVGEAKALTAWVGDDANGPWTEIWKNDGSTRTHWEVVLEKPQMCRYVKLGSTEQVHLHLNEVRIFEKR